MLFLDFLLQVLPSLLLDLVNHFYDSLGKVGLSF